MSPVEPHAFCMSLRFLLGLATCLQYHHRHKAHYHGYCLTPCTQPVIQGSCCSNCHGWGRTSVGTGSSMVPGFKSSVVTINIFFIFLVV